MPIALSRRTGPEIAEDIRAVKVHLPVKADEGNDHVQPLDAVEDISDYWEDSPRPKHLHILVQKPSGALQNTFQYIALTIFFFFITRRFHSSLRFRITSSFTCPPLSANSNHLPISVAAEQPGMSRPPPL